MRTWIRLLLAATHILAGPASGMSFRGLGDLPGPLFSSGARGGAMPGPVIVGVGTSASGPEAFKWTPSTGMTGLGDLPGGSASSAATAATLQGAVVVGYGTTGTGAFEAVRWFTGPGGTIERLGVLPGATASRALDVSTNLVIIGWSGSATGDEAFRWTQANGMAGLGSLPGGSESQAFAVSADGSVIVGWSRSPSGDQAFRWTQTDGMMGLGDLPGGIFFSVARAVSADGAVVVGSGVGATGDLEAFRWTALDGMVGLGGLPGGSARSIARAVSADGAVVGGTSDSGAGNEAFIWNAGEGMRSLKTVLVGRRANTTGWILRDAVWISPDGLSIAGGGTNPSGDNEAWLADLRAAPRPNPSAPPGMTLAAWPLALFLPYAGACLLRRRIRR